MSIQNSSCFFSPPPLHGFPLMFFHLSSFRPPRYSSLFSALFRRFSSRFFVCSRCTPGVLLALVPFPLAAVYLERRSGNSAGSFALWANQSGRPDHANGHSARSAPRAQQRPRLGAPGVQEEGGGGGGLVPQLGAVRPRSPGCSAAAHRFDGGPLSDSMEKAC